MAFVPEAALIALREGLEAFLIVGILLALVTRLGRPDARKVVWAGFAVAVAASLLLGLAVQRFVFDAFEAQGGGAWFELVAILVAVPLLTYMIFWMWSHTRELLAGARGRVALALTSGGLFAVAGLAFASVLREGLEVVLFYGALVSRASAWDLAWSGLAGFAASALLVLLILKGIWRVDLQRFFAVTGILLALVAGGLLVHGADAATDLGLVAPAPAIWDTSSIIADDSPLGRVLHALVGYAATPTLLQAVLYFGYVLTVAGVYLWTLGAFHARSASGPRMRAERTAAAALAVLMIAAGVGYGAANPLDIEGGHVHGASHSDESASAEGRVGILLRSHGEPVHYNETTYQSFADFIRNLFVMLGYEELLLVDHGTVLLDKSRPFEKGQHLDADLMDAWTRPYSGPAFYVGTPAPELAATQFPFLDGHYLAPGGPGLGEPDILELAGLSAFVSWLQMENHSPMHHQKLRILDEATRMLEGHLGERVVVRHAYHVLPHVTNAESESEAARAFVEAGVELVVDAYTSAIFSDVMNTCMMRPHLLHALSEAGYHGRLVHATPSGLTRAYAEAVAEKVQHELGRLPPDANVGVHLTHHGLRPGSANPCGSGEDQYHANARAMFDHSMSVLEARGALRDGVTVRQVYGQGADDPNDGVLSPREALQAARRANTTRVVDIPYELTGNGYDNLVVHRTSYGLDPARAPHYDRAYETHLTVHGMSVRIASSAYGVDLRAAALVDVVLEALQAASEDGNGAGSHDHGINAPKDNAMTRRE